MTSDQKVKYVEDFISLVAEAATYRDAIAHANFARGLMWAWHTDLTIRTDQFHNLETQVHKLLEEKRKLPMKGDIV